METETMNATMFATFGAPGLTTNGAIRRDSNGAKLTSRTERSILASIT